MRRFSKKRENTLKRKLRAISKTPKDNFCSKKWERIGDEMEDFLGIYVLLFTRVYRKKRMVLTSCVKNVL